jgi:hypothetical protein
MPLFHTPTGVAAGTTAQHCPKLPAGQQIVPVPLPGAAPFRCPVPCGGQCRFTLSACVPPPPLPVRLAASLLLAPTLLALVADALAYPVNSPGGTGWVCGPAGELALVGRRQYTQN